MALMTLTDESFNPTVEDNKIVIIDFWAAWCGPCKSFAPIFEKTAEKYPDIAFAKLNTEEQQGIASHFQIRSIPTTMILKEQVVVFQEAGVLPEAAFIDIIEQVQALDMDMVRSEIAKQSAEAETEEK